MQSHQIRHLGVQVIRRVVQLGVIGGVCGLAFVSLYAHYRAARALDDEQLMSGWKGAVLGQIDRNVSTMEHPQAFLDGWKGTLWSLKAGGLDLTDPLAAAEMTAATGKLFVPIMISAAIPFFVTLVLGKVFCSWICPAGLLFELSGKLRKLLRVAEVNPPAVTFSHRNKYALLAVGLLLSTIIGLPIFAMIYPPAVLSRLAHAWIFGSAAAGLLLLIGLMVVFELFVSPRWWCRTMCPGGALYGLVGWPRLLRVKLDQHKCTGCQDCIPVCEAGINPITQSDSIECDNCGVCIRHCADHALVYTIGLPGKKSWSLAGRRSPDVSPGIKLPVISSMILAALLTPQAEAHHILGIPHYSYKENYPQAPTLEYPAASGPYDLLLTSYPGKPVPGEPADLAFYIKNRNNGRPYDRSITVRVLQTSTFGSNREIVPPTRVQPFEVPHKLTATFPTDGEYVVELTLDIEGVPEVISFLMVAGNPTATGSVLGATGLGLAIFVIVIRAIKIKRARRMAARTAESHSTLSTGAQA